LVTNNFGQLWRGGQALLAAYLIFSSLKNREVQLIDEGLSFAEILTDYYPELQEDDIHTCLRYAIALIEAEDIHLAAITT